jgi:hypothetical protein
MSNTSWRFVGIVVGMGLGLLGFCWDGVGIVGIVVGMGLGFVGIVVGIGGIGGESLQKMGRSGSTMAWISPKDHDNRYNKGMTLSDSKIEGALSVSKIEGALSVSKIEDLECLESLQGI